MYNEWLDAQKPCSTGFIVYYAYVLLGTRKTDWEMLHVHNAVLQRLIHVKILQGMINKKCHGIVVNVVRGRRCVVNERMRVNKCRFDTVPSAK
jgi:hypothetical protein